MTKDTLQEDAITYLSERRYFYRPAGGEPLLSAVMAEFAMEAVLDERESFVATLRQIRHEARDDAQEWRRQVGELLELLEDWVEYRRKMTCISQKMST